MLRIHPELLKSYLYDIFIFHDADIAEVDLHTLARELDLVEAKSYRISVQSSFLICAQIYKCSSLLGIYVQN